MTTPGVKRACICSYAAGAFAAAGASGGIGYGVTVDFEGHFDQAVVYTNIFDVPGSATFVNEAGGVAVGDFFEFDLGFRVTDGGELEFGSIWGDLPGTRTFGNPLTTPLELIGGVRNNGYLTGGDIVYGHDIVRTIWRGSDDGFNGTGIAATRLTLELVLLAEPGTLISTDERVLAPDFESFRSAITGAHLRLSYPNAFSYDAFITDPDFAIVPAPAAAFPLFAGVGLAALRRRR